MIYTVGQSHRPIWFWRWHSIREWVSKVTPTEELKQPPGVPRGLWTGNR